MFFLISMSGSLAFAGHVDIDSLVESSHKEKQQIAPAHQKDDRDQKVPVTVDFGTEEVSVPNASFETPSVQDSMERKRRPADQSGKGIDKLIEEIDTTNNR